MKICIIENCGKKHYGKGYCTNHYHRFHRNGDPLYKRKIQICSYKGCQRKHISKGYCSFHYQRNIHNRPLDLPLNYRLGDHKGGFISGKNKGEKNINWKGGVSEYPNHYKMKQIRKQRLIEENYICQICNKKANQIHHIDKTKINHDLKNFMVLCQKCHISNFHKTKKQTSKFIRLYGESFGNIQKSLNKSYSQLYSLHKKDLLKNLLAS